jgi:antitoxin component YwqK of YwqJK toxin-antitoxin module
MKKQDIKSYNDKGHRHGYWEEYYRNGRLFFKGNYVSGVEDGYWQVYHTNGQLRFKGKYVNGNRHGHFESYHSNGKLIYKGYYDMGLEVDYVVNVEPEVTPEMNIF